MKTTKRFLLGVLASLLFSVGFAQASAASLAQTEVSVRPIPGPGDGGPPAQ